MGAQAAGQGSTRHLYERYPHPCVLHVANVLQASIQHLQELQPALFVKCVERESFPLRALHLANCAQKASFQQSGRRHQHSFASPAVLASIQNMRAAMPRQPALIVPWAHTQALWDRRLLHRVSSADLASTYLLRAQLRRVCV